MAGGVERGSGQPPPQGGDQGHLVMVISMMIVMMIMTLIIGASSSQESATRVKGRMQRVVHMISVNSEQNTRLTWDGAVNGIEPQNIKYMTNKDDENEVLNENYCIVNEINE